MNAPFHPLLACGDRLESRLQPVFTIRSVLICGLALVVTLSALGAEKPEDPVKVATLQAVVEQVHDFAEVNPGSIWIVNPQADANSLTFRTDARYLEARLAGFGLTNPPAGTLPGWIALLDTSGVPGTNSTLPKLELAFAAPLKSIAAGATGPQVQWTADSRSATANFAELGTNWLVRLDLLEVKSPTEFRPRYAGRISSTNATPLTRQQVVPGLIGALMGKFPGSGSQSQEVQVEVYSASAAVPLKPKS